MLFLQVSLDYLFNFFSTITEHFLNSDNWLEQCQDRDSNYNKFLEILSYIFICWAKVIDCQLFTEIATHNQMLVPLVQSHSQFFQKSSLNSTLLQVRYLTKNINMHIMFIVYTVESFYNDTNVMTLD